MKYLLRYLVMICLFFLRHFSFLFMLIVDTVLWISTPAFLNQVKIAIFNHPVLCSIDIWYNECRYRKCKTVQVISSIVTSKLSNYIANGSMFNHKISSPSPLRSGLAESSPAPHSWPSSRPRTAGWWSLAIRPASSLLLVPSGGVAAGWWAWRLVVVWVEPWPELLQGWGPRQDW